MESSLITRDIFRRFISCQHKAYASARLRETGDDRLGLLIASRAERTRQTWMEKQHAAPSL
jgi:hypothetical protein